MSEYQNTLNQIRDELLSHDNFVIFSHRKPDGDTLGCALALMEALSLLGKKAIFACTDSLTQKYLFLNGGREADEYSGGADYMITVDVADAAQMLGEKYVCYSDKIDLSIDHHGTNTRFAGRLNAVYPECGACGEIIYDLIRVLGVSITDKIAISLYTALSTDTGCFRFSNTTANTHRIAAELFGLGIDFSELNYRLFTLKSKARIALDKSLYRTMALHFGGRVCIALITKADMEEAHAGDADIDGLSELVRSVEGVEIGILAHETNSGIRVSMRSNGDADVSGLCKELGGGGHIHAAGCTIDVSPEEAVQFLLRAVARHLK